ncbi:Translation initiation factor eIF-2B subunit delta [Heracleum sosnowskyi]|uniref:Translation initiation factor eIF2B subunit delta n=1 Tax=Heracleum sosnowskyi TaxID=360622 RepID=A0AAD8H443_9APIA|nr:Translation initiation factor eIF-2B subunit delta [Heracleum sosnowskyi]
MDPRRASSRTVIDPKVRQVGFFTGAPPDPTPTTTTTTLTSPVVSPSGNSMSPVMIPPPTHFSDNSNNNNINSCLVGGVGVESVVVGSRYNLDSEFSGSKGECFAKVVATSLPVGGFEMPLKVSKGSGGGVVASSLTTVSMLSGSSGLIEKGRLSTGAQNESSASLMPLKEKSSKAERRAAQEANRAAKGAAKSLKGTSSKAERRAVQEAERAAKAAAKAEGKKAPASTGIAGNVKAPRAASQKKDSSSIAATEKRGGDRAPDKDRKKEVPHPRLQFDDESRVEKAKKRAVVKQREARNRVELFRHLPQYEHGTRLPDLESKFFHLDPVHPAVYKVGIRYLAGDISGGNARCIAMLQAFQESIKSYSTPAEKALNRDLTAKINCYVSFLIECRPISISMGNAIKFVKTRIANLPLTLSETEAKATLLSDIDRFINEKIILADQVIVNYAVTKVRDGDVLLTYGSSSAVEMILLHAHELGKHFRVVIVDSRPKLEGRLLLRRLVGKGLNCTYTHINAVSYIMHEVTRVLLGASSVLSNGTVYSRVGTASVAMVAHAFSVPVLVCCEAYKFHERVQLDSICSNELGDPDAISNVYGRDDLNYLKDWATSENLQLLNLIYDATPSDYVSMIITDYGMIPPTSVPVVVREYRKENLYI